MGFFDFVVIGAAGDWGKNFWDNFVQPTVFWVLVAFIGFGVVKAIMKGSAASLIGIVVIGGLALAFVMDVQILKTIGDAIKNAVLK